MATSEFYKHYLKSPEWRELAERRLRIDKFRCCACGTHGTADNPLQIHHASYRRLGEEDIYRDIFTLCKSCHKLIHRAMDRTTGYDEHGRPRHGWSDSLRSYVCVSAVAGDLYYTELRDDQE